MIFTSNDYNRAQIPFIDITLTNNKNPGDWIIQSSHDVCSVYTGHSVFNICYETIVIHSFAGIANNDICNK